MTNIIWAVLLAAVAMVESSNNPLAYNPDEGAVGAYQIRQLAVTDLNRLWKANYKLEDFYDANLSMHAFMGYGHMYGAKTAEEYCRIWNGGPKGMKKKATEKYWHKVQKAMREQK